MRNIDDDTASPGEANDAKPPGATGDPFMPAHGDGQPPGATGDPFMPCD